MCPLPLQAKALLPEQHIVDAGFVDANLIVTSQQRYGIRYYSNPYLL